MKKVRVINLKLHTSWDQVPAIQNKDHLRLLEKFEQLRQQQCIYPATTAVFYAFERLPLDDIKVIILGQDPYHGPGQAHGLSFSVPDSIQSPPSLKNIFKEIRRDIYPGAEAFQMSSDLTRWADQGVFLLNSVLTVKAGTAGSHRNMGWEQLTDDVIQTISGERSHCVFMLWGKAAQQKEHFINPDKHLILTTSHPSPLGAYRGFNGCGHFSKANRYLIQHGKQPIEW